MGVRPHRMARAESVPLQSAGRGYVKSMARTPVRQRASRNDRRQDRWPDRAPRRILRARRTVDTVRGVGPTCPKSVRSGWMEESVMSRVSEIGAAVIGTGFIGTVHVEALRRIGVSVRGVLGSSPDRGRERAEALGVARAYPSLEALLADESVDVVHVTSPNHLHVPQARQILDAGRHVVCEKPLAMTAAESSELVAVAERSGLVNAVNFNIRFYPVNQHAHDLVAEGGLGDVRFVTGRYFQDWLLLDTDWNWRLEPDKGGALRAVGDIGSHWLDLLSFITGRRVEAVMADLATFIPVRQQPRGPV